MFTVLGNPAPEKKWPISKSAKTPTSKPAK
jgi:hypothetical protein